MLENFPTSEPVRRPVVKTLVKCVWEYTMDLSLIAKVIASGLLLPCKLETKSSKVWGMFVSDPPGMS